MSSMLDHVGFSAGNMKASLAFYESALKPLGITLLMNITPEMTGTDDAHAGFGADRPFFWIGTSDKPSPGMHVAFLAQSRKIVAFIGHELVSITLMAQRECARLQK